LSLVDSSGAVVNGNAVTSGSTIFAKAAVKDAAGAAVVSKLVSFTSTGGVIAFQPASGQVLTDSTGVATVQVAPASINSAGADTLTASTTVNSTPLTASLDVQTSASNVSLANLTPAQASLTAYQNTTVSVDVAVNGAPATTTPVTVAFTASCGTFSPATSVSNSAGKASSTFQAAGCSGGNATLTASAPGAAPATATVTVQAAQATNLLFLSANPTTIYTSAASSGVKQSTVKFKVVDAAGNPVASSQVQVSLSPSAIAAGVVFADTNSTAAQTISTDVTGTVSVIVKSGAFPTPLSLTAVLVSNPAITAASSGLSVDSGRAVQNFFSLAATTFAIEGYDNDGEITTLTVRAADRLGQPVPAGTPVSFITEGGQVTASCSLSIDVNNKSGCSVSLQSQAFRPSNGRVTVLAYMDGDEIFVDSNGNNRYDAGETFYDMGQPFLDTDEDGAYSATEQKVGDPSVAGSGIGTAACAPHPYLVANVPNTCDGAWGPTRVRGQLVISFSTSFADTLNPFTNLTSTGVTVHLKDQHGNAMPAGTVVTATLSGGTNCSLADVIPSAVPTSTTLPTDHLVVVKKGSTPGDTCSGASVSVKATTPKNNTTLLGTVIIP
jgi:hypothetical protein